MKTARASAQAVISNQVRFGRMKGAFVRPANRGQDVRKLAIALMVLPLSGCGPHIVDRIKNQERVAEAGRDYRKCLLDNTGEPQRCEALRQVWEAEKAVQR
jgi:hypothetical protein